MPALPDSLKPILFQMNFGARAAVDAQNRVHVLVMPPPKTAPFYKGLSSILHDLFVYPKPTASVIVWYFEIQEPPRNPLRQVMCFDVQDFAQARDLERLLHQATVLFHLVDGETRGVLTTKEIPSPSNTRMVLNAARDWASGIPVDQYDFNKAKTAFQGEHPPDKIADLLLDFPAHAKTCRQCHKNFADVFSVMRKVLDLEGPEE